jgi:hypothetical protein
VIQWHPTPDNPAADRAECFVATGTAIALALAAGATAGGQIYAAHAGSEAATEGARLQSDATSHGIDAQSRANQDALDFQKEQLTRAEQRQQEAERANYQQYYTRALGARTLGQSIGFDLPEPLAPGSKIPAGTSGGRRTSQYAGQDATLGELLKSGVDPAQAIAQFNQQYGRTTGNEATFAHDNTIAVPSGYYATGANGWQFAPGDHSGTLGGALTMAPTGSLGNVLNPQTAVAPPAPLQPFYRPGTIGFAIGRR